VKYKQFTVCVARLYIGCDTCSRWYHGSCVGVSAGDIKLMTAYMCPECISRTALSDQPPAYMSRLTSSNKCWAQSSRVLDHLEVTLLCPMVMLPLSCNFYFETAVDSYVPCLYSSWIMSGCTIDYSNFVRNGAVFVQY